MEPPPLQKTPAKPPLITPSASPPPLRQIVPTPYRVAESISPLKRPRVSSTPRPTQPQASSSKNHLPDQPIDFEKEREASTLRLLDVWSQLAERYTRRLDEDDIVDLSTNRIIKDTGVLRNSRITKFGDMQAPEKNDEAVEDDEAEEEEWDEDDDVDELDSFAHIGVVELEGEGEQQEDEGGEGQDVPPVIPMDPQDAEDLRQFLEAERMRKEICGSEPEDDPDERSLAEDEGDPRERSHSEAQSDYTEDIEYVEYDEDADVEDAEAVEQEPGEEAAEGTVEPQPEDEGGHDMAFEGETEEIDNEGLNERFQSHISIDSDSEDELNNNWEEDEASVAIPVLRQEQVEDVSDSEVEVIEPPLPPKKPPLGSLNDKPSKTRRKLEDQPSISYLQLHTPPQSHSSSDPLPNPTHVRALSSPPPPSPLALSLSPESPLPPLPRQPLRSSPRSKPSHEMLPLSEGKKTLPRLDLSKVIKGKTPRPSPLRKHLREGSNPLLNDALPTPRKMKAEVLIEKRVPFPVNPKPRPTPKKNGAVDEAGRDDSTAKSLKPGKSKGKERAVPVPPIQRYDERSPEPPFPTHEEEPQQESDDPIIILSSSSSAETTTSNTPRKRELVLSKCGTSKIRTSKVKRSASQPAFPEERQSLVLEPARPVSVSPRKRKRGNTANTAESYEQPPQENVASSSKHITNSERLDYETDSSNHSRTKDARRSRSQRSPRKHRSKSRSRRSDSDASHSESEGPDSGGPYHPYHYPHGHPGGLYPYPQQLYPHPLPNSNHPPQHGFAPIPDPRAQFIISQAMHQLSALVGGHWNSPTHPPQGPVPMPFTPSRHQSNGDYVYSTPPHHCHPYPYGYDPELSRATLPPDTPEHEIGSSPMEKGERGRRKSLVARSYSRGRKVSFKIDKRGEDSMDVSSSPLGPKSAANQSDLHFDWGRKDSAKKQRPHHRGKGKSRATGSDAEAEGSSDSDSGPDQNVLLARGRAFVRGQTPGPVSVAGPSHSSCKAQKPAEDVQQKARSRSRSRHP